jgi:hypothetical protein
MDLVPGRIEFCAWKCAPLLRLHIKNEAANDQFPEGRIGVTGLAIVACLDESSNQFMGKVHFKHVEPGNPSDSVGIGCTMFSSNPYEREKELNKLIARWKQEMPPAWITYDAVVICRQDNNGNTESVPGTESEALQYLALLEARIAYMIAGCSEDAWFLANMFYRVQKLRLAQNASRREAYRLLG